jgi:hypothetical protein
MTNIFMTNIFMTNIFMTNIHTPENCICTLRVPSIQTDPVLGPAGPPQAGQIHPTASIPTCDRCTSV